MKTLKLHRAAFQDPTGEVDFFYAYVLRQLGLPYDDHAAVDSIEITVESFETYNS